MARFLANFASCPLLGPGRHFQSETCSSQAPALRIQSFSSGLRASSALDLTARPGQDLFFKVNLSISSRRGKASRCVTKATFEGLTEKAVKVIRLSQAEARKLGHDSVGTEHILVGLIREETGIAAKVLTSMGITLEDTREEVEKIIGRGSGSIMPGEIPFTPRAKCVLDLSLEEARKLGHYEVGPEHLLLALLRKEGEGVASRVLENLGAYHSDIWKQVIRMICKNNEEKSRYVYKGVDEDIKMPRPEENEDDDLTKVKNRDEEEDVPGKSVMIFNFFF